MDYSHIGPQLAKVEEFMKSAIGGEDQRIYGMLWPYIFRGGKRIRPALCLLCCGSSGADPEKAVAAAGIIELFHNFSLIHDDIEDDSRFRRGEPTLHVSHGLAIALNSGDALYTLLLQRMVRLEMRPKKLLMLQEICISAFKRVVDGQGLELSWIRDGRFDVSEKEYMDMIGGKTSALMGLSCEAGALIAGAGKRERARLRKFGEALGSAFQIQDDVLNLMGDFEKYRKEIGGDISEGKRTLIVVHALANAPEPERSRLKDILSSHTKDQGEIAEAISIMKSSGSIEHARKRAERLVAETKSLLMKVPDSPHREALAQVADYVLTRER